MWNWGYLCGLTLPYPQLASLVFGTAMPTSSYILGNAFFHVRRKPEELVIGSPLGLGFMHALSGVTDLIIDMHILPRLVEKGKLKSSKENNLIQDKDYNCT